MEGTLQNNLKASQNERLLAAAGLFVIAAGSFLVWFFNPVTAGFFPACPLHQMTGLNCSGCGMTRGFHALFHGDIPGALRFNALLPVVLFVGIYILAWLGLVVVRGRGLSFNIFRPSYLWIFLGMLIIFGIVRNFPFYPFTLLSP